MTERDKLVAMYKDYKQKKAQGMDHTGIGAQTDGSEVTVWMPGHEKALVGFDEWVEIFETYGS